MQKTTILHSPNSSRAVVQLRKFPDINQFRHVVERVTHRAEYLGQGPDDEPLYDHARAKPTLTFHGTVKLHGSNGGVAFDLVAGTVEAQSRERILSVADDNHGFCAWVESPEGSRDLAQMRQALLAGCAAHAGEIVALRVFGEWCGSAVNGKTGIGKLPTRWVVFAVLATLADGAERWLSAEQAAFDWATSEPAAGSLIHFIADYPRFSLTIDFNAPEAVLDTLERLTLDVEAQCPVARALGGDGIGEGIVWTCTHLEFGHLVFKTKGTKHKGTKSARLVEVAPEVLASLDAFTEAVLTDSRLEQGFDLIAADCGKVTADHIGRFLQWVGRDVMKEEADTLVASGLERQRAMGRINHSAKAWLLPRLAQI